MLTARFRRLGLSKGARVLDLGCGEGRHVHGLYMQEHVHVVGADLDLPSLQKAHQGLGTLPQQPESADKSAGFLQANALALPFADDTFDAVICSEVLEHIPLYMEVLAEIRRVLKPRGRICLSVPRAWPEKICWRLAPPPGGYAFEPGGHIRIFDKLELKTALREAGFNYDGMHHAHALHSPYWWLKCLFWNREKDPLSVRLYHRFLVWDLMKRPWLTRGLEALLNPLLGKSAVFYFHPKDAE